ncbi:MAG: ribonuclease P protein component [Candidatus Kapaibacteriales bacterium]
MQYKFEPIKRKKLFEFLFQNGERFSSGSLRTVIYPSHLKEPPTAFTVYYAVYVPKKQARKSVVRNRIKRLLRVALRKVVADDLSERFWVIQYIWLGWWTAPLRPCEISLWDVYPVVREVLSQAVNKYSIENLEVGQ